MVNIPPRSNGQAKSRSAAPIRDGPATELRRLGRVRGAAVDFRVELGPRYRDGGNVCGRYRRVCHESELPGREQSLAEQFLEVTDVAGRGLACLIADEVVRLAAALGVVGREPGGRVVFQEIDAGGEEPRRQRQQQ